MLEHEAFKGSRRIGTTDWQRERPLLDAQDEGAVFQSHERLVADPWGCIMACSPETTAKLLEAICKWRRATADCVMSNPISQTGASLVASWHLPIQVVCPSLQPFIHAVFKL